MYGFEKPILKTNTGNCAAIACFTLHVELFILIMRLSFFDCCWSTAIPRPLKKSRPVIFLISLSTTVRHASSQVQSLHVTVVVSFLRTLIGSFEEVFKSFSFIQVIHRPVGVSFWWWRYRHCQSRSLRLKKYYQTVFWHKGVLLFVCRLAWISCIIVVRATTIVLVLHFIV